ncbi:MAG: TraR/DksA family transcriptional regulator [Sphaerochaetaceae bacterium]|nr:TraR/DksA family transcriptional regulator [Sphaerochaetaceae bacterium]
MEKDSSSFEKEMEKVLLESRTALIKKMAKNDDFLNSLVNEGTSDNSDSIDLATEELAKRGILAINRQDASTLNSIEHAIVRIKNGSFGHCALCGKPIPQERLRAVPYAVLCYSCKNAEEKRKKNN